MDIGQGRENTTVLSSNTIFENTSNKAVAGGGGGRRRGRESGPRVSGRVALGHGPGGLGPKSAPAKP